MHDSLSKQRLERGAHVTCAKKQMGLRYSPIDIFLFMEVNQEMVTISASQDFKFNRIGFASS